jgi:nucleotide-binding universal stress UspA family protein
MATLERKILVAVDGSYCSENEISYLKTIFEGEGNISFHLMSVFSGGSLPVGSDWMDEEDKLMLLSSTSRQKMLLAKKNLKMGIDSLKRQGFSDEQISGEVKFSTAGVANDLVHEARKGSYDALLVGRRGLGKIQAFFMGSITKSVLEKCFDIPIWVVDGKVESKKILVPVDGSYHVLRAVDHLGFILKDIADVEITLFHSDAILQKKMDHPIEDFYAQWGKEWCDEHLTGEDALFHAPEQVLVESGIGREKIKRVKDKFGLKPARDIYSYLRRHNYGTIVMGRRGADEATWLLGSISDQLLHTAENLSIWMVH